MKFSKEFEAELSRVEKINKEIALGLHKSNVVEIIGAKDAYGFFINPILRQEDTGVCTIAYDPDEIQYKDIVRIRKGDNRNSAKGYAIREGDGWVRFLRELEEQRPEFKKLRENADWRAVLENLEGKTIKVWYTRSRKGYIQIHLTENAYQFAINGGATGADEDAITPDESRTLNEDIPF